MTTLGTPDNGHPRSASAIAVAGLAREVEALRKRLDGLDALKAKVRDLARVVTTLAAEVGNLATGTGLTPEPPTTWLALGESEQLARELLDELVGWVMDVYLRYADAAKSLPECWLWHPDIVEELLWLMQTWRAAYVEAAASLRAAADWHDRYRPGVVRRIKEQLSRNCSLENHTARGIGPTTGEQPVMDPDAREAIARWWGAHRLMRAPEPTPEQCDANTEPRGQR